MMRLISVRFALTTSFAILTANLLSLSAMGGERIVHVAGGQQDQVGIQATQARLKEPFGTAFDSNYQLWIIEMASGNRLMRIDKSGRLDHIAGRSEKGFHGDGGVALDAQFNGPHNLAIRPDGRILIADTWNGRIRQVDPRTGLVESLPGYLVPIEKAKGSGPYCITLDFSGNQLYVADLHRIHRLDLVTNKTTVVAGNGEKGIPKDGSLAIASPLSDPRAVAIDRTNNVYILERGGNALRIVRPDGKIYTVVNTSGKKGTARDAIEEIAANAMMNGPKHLCIDLMDRVIIADAENHLIRRYDPRTEMICRMAGTGESGSRGVGGPPLSCQLARPHGVTVHSQSGELYITDSYNNRVLQIVNDRE
ncbi:MAG: hypothetical protein SGI77_08800 [Pirellulaceae bacterium]|nr:hypothetical protein [Pirellulaceae bacterium]